jgi:hypothetical protein
VLMLTGIHVGRCPRQGSRGSSLVRCGNRINESDERADGSLTHIHSALVGAERLSQDALERQCRGYSGPLWRVVRNDNEFGGNATRVPSLWRSTRRVTVRLWSGEAATVKYWATSILEGSALALLTGADCAPRPGSRAVPVQDGS